MAASLRDALREATRDLHARLDAGVDLGRTPSRDGYARFLLGHYEVLSWLEPALLSVSSFADALGDAATRRKLPWLEADLAALGAKDSVKGASFAVDGAAHAWGAAYVIEGSTLGAALLERKVERELPEARGATRYLHAYGPERGTKWSRFLEALERFGAAADPADHDRVTAAARATFGAFERAFRARGVLAED